MDKVKINNEVILLRQYTRQARVCVINKLIREAKRLRTNNGQEKQMERNKKRADKLLKEVYTLKQIKDDEISKFGIKNFENLQQIVQNPSTNDRTRITAKVARYKTLYIRITEFRDKFPDCEKLITCGGKKSARKKSIAGANVAPAKTTDVNPDTNTDANTDEKDTPKRDCSKIEEKSETNEEPKKSQRAKRPRIDKKLDSEKERNHPSKEEEPSVTLVSAVPVTSSKKEENQTEKLIDSVHPESSKQYQEEKNVKVISKEATVKRFTDILKDTSATEVDEEVDAEKDEQQELEHNEEATVGTGEATEQGGRKRDNFFLNSDEEDAVYDSPPASPLSPQSDSAFKSRRDTTRRSYQHPGISRKPRSFGKPTKNFMTGPQRGFENRKRGETLRNSKSFVDTRHHPSAEHKKISTEKKSDNTKNVETEKLHPSWLARKKQQEIMKQGFRGTKILFDD